MWRAAGTRRSSNRRKFDDPKFTADRSACARRDGKPRTRAAGRADAAHRADRSRRSASIRRTSCPQPPSRSAGRAWSSGLRFTPLDSAGLYFPGGKASYPSSLIMLAVPAQVAGVKRIVVCTPPSKYGRSDLVLGGVSRAGARARLPRRWGGRDRGDGVRHADDSRGRQDRRPGQHLRAARQAAAGRVASASTASSGPARSSSSPTKPAEPDFIAADLIAQAEHDPGSCFLLTTSTGWPHEVDEEIDASRPRRSAQRRRSTKALRRRQRDHRRSVDGALIELANRFAAEHVNLQTKDDEAVLDEADHARRGFRRPVLAGRRGDYVAGPSHCLPTNTTARFASGISVYEFLKRISVVRYEAKVSRPTRRAIDRNWRTPSISSGMRRACRGSR